MSNYIKNLILNGFFGWENFKWFVREWAKTFSGEPSFFTSKRVERFFFVLSGLIFYYWYNYLHIATMGAADFVIVNGPLFVYAGYNLKQIQNEKKELLAPKTTTSNPQGDQQEPPKGDL